MRKYIKQLVNKKIAILGYGVNNQHLLDWLLVHGARNIAICDENSVLASNERIKKLQNNFGVKLVVGKNYLDQIDQFDIVFRTPGIPYFRPKIQKARKKGVEISSQTKLFLRLCPGKIIGVTGTKGKGTTSTLISEILKDVEASKITNVSKVYLAGNIGEDPFRFLDEVSKNDWVVLELSSFQLQDLDMSPHIAVILNITSDHLDYHKSVSEYQKAKENIVRFQKKEDFTVINLDYLTSFKFAEISPTQNDYYFSTKKSVDLGAYVEWNQSSRTNWGTIILRTQNKDYKIIRTYDVKLRGRHNLENLCAAICASHLAKAKIGSIKKVISEFKGLKHRLELVYEKEGIKYYNDSASTNPDTTIAALKSFSEPIILIAGGSSKGADYKQLGQEIAKSSVKTLISIGETGPEIIKIILQNNKITKKQVNRIKIIKNCKNMEEIVEAAKNETKSGDVVLLSPASASFGMFQNYADRGDQFRENVMKYHH